MNELAERRAESEELLDEESLAVLAILLAVSLEFGFGFAKTVDWWAGLVAGPAALATLVTLFRLRTTHGWLVRAATWVVRSRSRRPASEPGAPFGRRASTAMSNMSVTDGRGRPVGAHEIDRRPGKTSEEGQWLDT